MPAAVIQYELNKKGLSDCKYTNQDVYVWENSGFIMAFLFYYSILDLNSVNIICKRLTEFYPEGDENKRIGYLWAFSSFSFYNKIVYQFLHSDSNSILKPISIFVLNLTNPQISKRKTFDELLMEEIPNYFKIVESWAIIDSILKTFFIDNIDEIKKLPLFAN